MKTYENGFVASQIGVGDVPADERRDVARTGPVAVLHVGLGVGESQLCLEEEHEGPGEAVVRESLAELRHDDVAVNGH